MDTHQLASIIINNYEDAISKNIDIKLIATIKNVIFINYLKKIDNTESYKNPEFMHKNIISQPSYYHIIKEILLETIEYDRIKLENDFKKLEEAGFNAFEPYSKLNSQVKQLLKKDLAYMINTNISSKYIEKNNNASTILTRGQSTSLHTGILNMIEYMNMSRFMSHDVFMNINSKYTNVNVYKTNTNIEYIYLLASKDTTTYTPNYDVKKLPFLCQVADTIINTFNKFNVLNKNINNLGVNLILFLSSAKKLFPKHNTMLTENNINSADTHTFDPPLIRIYRSEEMIKVLMHELIHATNCDKLIDSTIRHKFNVNCPLKVVETITETFAEFFNCVLYSHINKIDLATVLEKEINFGFKQTAHILTHFNFISVDDFLESNNKTINQTTSVFEYHILKTILLFKFDEFLKFVSKRGNLQQLILTTMKSNEYQNTINKFIKSVGNLNTHKPKSFRMTLIDLNHNQTGGQSYSPTYQYYKNKYLQIKKTYNKLYI